MNWLFGLQLINRRMFLALTIGPGELVMSVQGRTYPESIPGLGAAASRSGLLAEFIFSTLIKAIDLFLIILAAVSAWVIYNLFATGSFGEGIERYVIPALLGSLFFVTAVSHLGGYKPERLKQLSWQVPRLLCVWMLMISTFLVAAFFTKVTTTYSRAWTLSWTVFALGFLFSHRSLLSLIFNFGNAGDLFRRKVIIIGAQEATNRICAKLHASSNEIRICSVFNELSFLTAPANVETAPREIEDLLRRIQLAEVDHVILAMPSRSDDRTKLLINKLRQLPTEVLISLEPIAEFADTLPILGCKEVGGLPTVEIVKMPIEPLGAMTKWLEDKIISLLMLIFTTPFMLIIAALIKLDSSGPVFFVQDRYGFNNKPIKVLKFRTMYIHAEDRSGAQRTVEGDPRVTRFGRILRAFSLDELPQLINVLKGDMSLVGPRAHAVAMKVEDLSYYDAIAEYPQRHRVKPGITGWAQINGLRGAVDSLETGHARVQYDLYYIERWSLWLDLKILVLTVPAVFTGRNAY
jgi:Undecaprenyl-phosphate glucose phosphotransferase